MLFASYASDAILMMKTLKAQKAQPKIVWGQDAGFEAPEFESTLGDDHRRRPDPDGLPAQGGQVKKVAGQVNDLYKRRPATI